MRIAVYGAGAVGGNVAVRLDEAGYDVSVVVRGAALHAIKSNGLLLEAGSRTITARVRASDRPADLGEQDLVISTLKATGLACLATDLKPLLGRDTPIIFAQNGIPWWYDLGLKEHLRMPPILDRLDAGGLLRRSIETERILGGVVNSSNEVVAPGRVKNDSPTSNRFTIGDIDDVPRGRTAVIRSVLERAGLSSPPVENVRQVIWRKLLINMSCSILCMVTGHKATIIRDDERLGALQLRMVQEACRIATAYGVDVSEADTAAFRRSPPDHKPSIRQDYELQRPVELDALLLAPLAFARAAGLETPSLDAVAAIATRLAVDAGVYRA